MKIYNNQNFYFQNINFNNLFTKGDKLTGEIIEIKGNLLLLDIKGLGIINAISDINLKNYIGREIEFIVKSVDENTINIKPNVDKESNSLDTSHLNRQEGYIENILKEFKIERNELNIEFIKSLIEYSVSLDEDNIYLGVSVLNKLKKIINPYKEVQDTDKNFGHTIKLQDFTLNENYLENRDVVFQSKNMPLDEKIKLLAKTVAFFIKHNIAPTIKNVNNFIELNLDLDLFTKEYEILKDFLDKEFTNPYKNIMIGNENSKNLVENFKDLIEYNKKVYLNNSNEILKVLKYKKTDYSEEINNTIESFESKLELLNQLNNELTFIYLPIDLKENLYNDSIMTLIKKKKGRYDFQDSINIFISLKTTNFGKVNIYCKVINNNMRIEFSNLSDEDINFFKSKESELKLLIESTGYDVVSIEYKKEKGSKILDVLSRNHNPLYCLDVKV